MHLFEARWVVSRLNDIIKVRLNKNLYVKQHHACISWKVFTVLFKSHVIGSRLWSSTGHEDESKLQLSTEKSLMKQQLVLRRKPLLRISTSLCLSPSEANLDEVVNKIQMIYLTYFKYISVAGQSLVRIVTIQ